VAENWANNHPDHGKHGPWKAGVAVGPYAKPTAEQSTVSTAKLVHMLRLETAAEDWFGDLTPKEQLVYLKAHPASKMKNSDVSLSTPGHDPIIIHNGLQEGVRKHAEHHAIKAAEHERKSGDFRERGQHGTAAVYQQGELHHREASDHYKDAHRAYSRGDVSKGHEHARKGANAADKAFKYEEEKRL
jgi:hypothetical protein